jgi:hypothetical protein
MATPTYTTNGKTFTVHPRGNRFFYWSPLAGRLLPVAKSKVSFA